MPAAACTRWSGTVCLVSYGDVCDAMVAAERRDTQEEAASCPSDVAFISLRTVTSAFRREGALLGVSKRRRCVGA